jgi:hypothetical protein
VLNPTEQLHGLYEMLEQYNLIPKSGTGKIKQAKKILKQYPHLKNVEEYLAFAFSAGMPLTHNVVLIHGIQDDGEWFEPIRSALEVRKDIKAIAGGYGFLSLRKFSRSKRAREAGYQSVVKALLSVPRQNQVTSVICHSFGTYCVTRALREYPNLAVFRLIMCGGVVPRQFPWEAIPARPASGRVINDCGNLDNVPIWAKWLSGGELGNTGRLGFARDPVRDRWHDVDHGGFLNEEFVSRYWAPFIAKGGFVSPEAVFKKLGFAMNIVAGRV